MRQLGEILRWSLCSSILAVALSVPTSRAADRGPPSGLSVRVVNTPLPVSGTVNVGNLPASQSISGSVTITNTPNVTVANTPLVVTGSVTHGTKVIADIEADDLDPSQHKFGPVDISQFSKIRLRVTANGSGSVIADIETDGLGDFFRSTPATSRAGSGAEPYRLEGWVPHERRVPGGVRLISAGPRAPPIL